MSFTPPGDLRALHPQWNGRDSYVKIPCLLPGHDDADPSYAVYYDHGYCYGCNEWVSYKKHVELVGQEPPVGTIQAQVEKVHYDQETLERWARTFAERLLQSPEALAPLLERGLELGTIEQFKLGYLDDAWSIPIYDGPDLMTIRFRRDDRKTEPGAKPVPKYWGLKGRNDAYLYNPVPPGERVVWCEGELDALLMLQCGYNAVSLTNGIRADPLPFLPRLAKVGEIIIGVDQDRASFRRSLQLAALFEENLTARVSLARFAPMKDLTDAYKHGGRALVDSVMGGLVACRSLGS